MKKVFFVLEVMLALVLIIMTLSGIGTMKPPASVVTTAFRMPYQFTVKYITLIIGGGVLIYLLYSIFVKKTFEISALFMMLVFVLIMVCGIGYQVRIASAKTLISGEDWSNYKVLNENSGKKGTTEDLSSEAGMEQCLVSLPEGGNTPEVCIIHLNYGGWQSQDEKANGWMKELAMERGYGYVQLAGRGCNEVDITDMVKDVYEGVSWIKHKYGFKKVFLSGESAGGSIALISAFSKNCADGVIALYPISDPAGAYKYYVLDNPTETIMDIAGNKLYSSLYKGTTGTLSGETKVLMDKVFGEYDSSENKYKSADILSLVKDQDIPVIIVQGQLDSMVCVEDNRNFYESMKNQEKNISYLELPGLDHAFDLMEGTEQLKKTKKVLTQWLGYFSEE